jgi:hypothetical protein
MGPLGGGVGSHTHDGQVLREEGKDKGEGKKDEGKVGREGQG